MASKKANSFFTLNEEYKEDTSRLSEASTNYADSDPLPPIPEGADDNKENGLGKSEAATDDADKETIKPEDLEGGDEDKEGKGDKDTLRLNYTWCIWEQMEQESQRGGQNYSDSVRNFASFKTVLEFWRLWMHIPQPSNLLNGKKMIRENKGEPQQSPIDALMIFRSGIEPRREDIKNKHGGHLRFEFAKNEVDPRQVDEFWNNLVIATVGHTLEGNELVTGLRLCDKLGKAGSAAGNVRLEVWHTKCESDVLDKLQASVENAMWRRLGPASDSEEQENGKKKATALRCNRTTHHM
uniref:Eukaryotic translation initiation factor 4E n=1 Tax=Chromera velia CCMP2878 TaxID=1169474 RepID=A0A0G4I5E3_9ALVE|mmetsp:Transcript_11421/g.21996  ORF Transcript_11421/g.21996 Transcript_11421/m.21996 type:complete len:296 (+) Transcript_11421:358-1245(+)|eukprot:Cvel_11077.t1-p1 / transcript=Cvel_11077.t1 / gene=Cvel_11077 / organism=Chromera_velia_CCMP2878 / gene_product=Eukaryotic translation initiation factor 4E, putative / transcript_product=Eukaryotic translation initiation factor 4E, putative / location=Cvel_scaffold684:56689-61128(+) / protein_length=295 / sequence_SO=supercontig / SO=protein_coding / is_pseudo=false